MTTSNKFFRVKNGLEVIGAEFKPAIGTTTYPPIQLTSSAGAVLGTPQAGAFEYDGTNFYLTATTGAGNRKTIAFTDLIPAAGTSTVLGTIKLFSDTTQSVTANAVSAAASRSYGLQINASGQGVVNVPWTDTVYTLPTATSTVLGGIEIFDNAIQTVTANAVTTTASRTYGLQLNASGQAVVNVPWVDTNTDTNWYPTAFSYTAGAAAGPTGSLTGVGMTAVSFGAIPSASDTASGVVTTGAQTFGGIKTLTSPSITTSLTTVSTSFDLLNTTATTLNIGGAATSLTLGATTGTGSIRNATVTFPNATAMTLGAASPTITFGTGPTLTTASGTVTLFNTGTTTVNAFGAATTLTLGASTGTATIANQTVTLSNATTLNINGATQSIVGGTVAGTASVFNTNTGTVNIAGAASTVNIGSASGTVVVAGNLTVNGITTTLNSSTLQVDDKNLELGVVIAGVVSTTGTIGTVSGAGPFTATITGMSSTTGLIPGQTITATAGTGNFGSGTVTVASIVSTTSITISSTLTFTAGTVTNITGSAASDASADGGGITLKGTTDKTFQWADTGDNWTSSENLSLAAGKTYKIANANIISGTAAALVIGEGASTSINIGNAAGTASILNPTVTLTNATTLNINGATQSIVGGTVAGTASVFNTNTGTVNFGGAASIVNIGGGVGKTTNIAGTGASLINIGSTSIGNTNTSIITIGTGGAGTGAKQQTLIGNHAGTAGVYETYIGATTTNSFTTIQGIVNLPSVGTSGFVILGAGGQLSADTSTYITSSSPTISSPSLTGTVYLDNGAIATTTFTTSGTTIGASPAIFNTTVYTGAEITIKAVNGTTMETIKALVMIDSLGNVYDTQYADILTGTQLIGVLNYTTTSNEFKISITPFTGTTGTTTYKAVLTLIEA